MDSNIDPRLSSSQQQLRPSEFVQLLLNIGAITSRVYGYPAALRSPSGLLERQPRGAQSSRGAFEAGWQPLALVSVAVDWFELDTDVLGLTRLQQHELSKGQVVNLLRVAGEPTVDISVRQVASISFKQVSKKYWEPEKGVHAVARQFSKVCCPCLQL